MRRIEGTGLSALGLAALVAACGGGAVTSTSAPGGGTNQPGGATSAPGGGGTGQATGAPVTDLTKLCDLLGPGDFSSVGINGASVATVNSDGPGSAYCTFTAQSAAQGGIELDVFVDDDAASTYQTILDEIGPVNDFPIPGVDESAGTDGVAGQADKPASVVVRKGKLVFTIAAPGGTNNSLALTQLALLVLARGAGLAG